jgi:hybrid cluster-associated redox disulfide protein
MTMILAVAVGVVFLLALWAFQRTRNVESSMDELISEIRKMGRESEERIEALRAELLRLKAQSVVATGKAHFKPEMTVGDALALHPRASEVFASYHIGGCSSCGVDATDTVREGAQKNGVDVSALVDSLNGLLVA